MAKRARKTKRRTPKHKRVAAKHKRVKAKQARHVKKGTFLEDFTFSLVIALMSLGLLTLYYIAQGTFMHLNNILTLFIFTLVSVCVIKHTHGLGKAQAFYSAFLAGFGYFLFYRVYNYLILGDFWKTSPIMGDSLSYAFINVVVIYVSYTFFLYAHTHEK